MMTNEEVLTQWHETSLQRIHERYEQDYRIDIPARNEDFNNYVDFLCKDGMVTNGQYNNFCLPDIYKTEYHPDLREALREIDY